MKNLNKTILRTFIATITTLSTTLAVADSIDTLRTKDVMLGTLTVGCQPKGLKITTKNEAWIAEMCGKLNPDTNRREPSASVVDIDLKKLITTIRTPMGVRNGIIGNTEVEFTENENFALIARAEGDNQSPVYPGYGMITVVNTDTFKTVKYIPVNGKGAKIINRRPNLGDGREIVYVANYFSDDISILDTHRLTENGSMDGREFFKGRITLKTSFGRPPHLKKIAPRGVGFIAGGKYALILATETGSIIVVDSIQHKQITELAPLPSSIAGRDVNVRHIVITKDGRFAYLSHMRGNAISKINLTKFTSIIEAAIANKSSQLPASVWNEILTPIGNNAKIMVLEDYPLDHPNFAGKKWNLAHPNTIVLDPVNNRYLYVSHRTTSNKNYEIIDPKVKGKIDIIDLQNGHIVMSLVGGAQPTALDVTANNDLLISAGFKDSKLYFYDLKKILETYEASAH